jgi:hypothetical protein
MEGAVERITYYSEEDGYTVARFQPEGRRLGHSSGQPDECERG